VLQNCGLSIVTILDVSEKSLKRKPRWSEAEIRKEQLDETIRETQTAYFGFERVPSAEKKERVLRHFNRIAGRYDLMNTILSFGIHHRWKRISIDLLHLNPGDRVLDVCGGTADLSILSANRVTREGRVVVYDINRSMMEEGRRKAEKGDEGGPIHFIQGDAECISFSEGSFDAVLVGFGIRNVTHMQKAFGEMHRVLKKGGKLMCLEFSKPVNPLFRGLYDFYSFHLMPLAGRIIAGSGLPYCCLSESIRLFPLPGELSEILEDIGFKAVSFRRLTNGIAVIHRGEKA
jgi:demethylmenaquinone methyltransferase/2-methoxy-6-polyprenyl-1,4-benzoquinol methylase